MTREAASADTMMAERFPADLKRIIEGGDYGAKQVFNVDETGIFCTHIFLRDQDLKQRKIALLFSLVATQRETLS